MCYIRQYLSGWHFCYLVDHYEMLWNWKDKFILYVDLEDMHVIVNCFEVWNVSDEGGINGGL